MQQPSGNGPASLVAQGKTHGSICIRAEPFWGQSATIVVKPVLGSWLPLAPSTAPAAPRPPPPPLLHPTPLPLPPPLQPRTPERSQTLLQRHPKRTAPAQMQCLEEHQAARLW